MSDRDTARRSIRRHLLAGAAVVVLLVGGVGGVAATTVMAGAVIASGRLVVDTSVKKVQHATGGTVAELLVGEGDHVAAGQVLLRLDATQLRAAAAIVAADLDELEARQARLEAEREGAAEIRFPAALLARLDQESVARAVSGERKLLELRRRARDGGKAQLAERVAQLRQEILGLQGQLVAKDREVALIETELAGVGALLKKGLVPLARATALQRDAARLAGERGQLVSAVAEAGARITETELQAIQIDEELRSEVGKELADIRVRLAELAERRVAAEDQLAHVEIRAPQAGRVHELAVHTVGGVIGPGEPIMRIVPDADGLAIEAKVSPYDIDQLHVGQQAALRFAAFDQRTTPELAGEIRLISADLSEDPRSGAFFYTVRLAPRPGEMARLDGQKPVPGMPVDAFIATGERSMLSYLVKPLRDQIARAFREK
ncbi:MAG: HlyD family type I secretion periplasmic adaptor subunit [Dongiaceae bacterium]